MLIIYSFYLIILALTRSPKRNSDSYCHISHICIRSSRLFPFLTQLIEKVGILKYNDLVRKTHRNKTYLAPRSTYFYVINKYLDILHIVILIVDFRWMCYKTK
jgi:hypothetical protein